MEITDMPKLGPSGPGITYLGASAGKKRWAWVTALFLLLNRAKNYLRGK
jgi:hypothetical protein